MCKAYEGLLENDTPACITFFEDSFLKNLFLMYFRSMSSRSLLAFLCAFALSFGAEDSLPVAASSDSAVPTPEVKASREVPVRYWVAGDSVEQMAIFVKIQNDTVFLKNPGETEQKQIEKLVDRENQALQASNGQEVEDSDDQDGEDVEIQKPAAEIIMTDAVKDSVAAQSEAAPVEVVPEDDGEDDDLETALAKEDQRQKMEEIAKVEEEIRKRDIQDSIEAAVKNPYIKIFRFELKRLFNLEDNVMIDLSQSNYVVPEIVEEEESIELYPPGNGNMLVIGESEACSLFVNGIPLNQVTPDTIKNIKPGKYTISIKKVVKDVERWGVQTVKINADSLNRVSISMLKPATRLTLNTNPENVEVFLNEAPTENIMPHFMTDVIVDEVKPQVSAVLYFRKVGYRDTSVTAEIRPYMPNLINVEMTPVLDDLDFIQQQRAFDKERGQRRVGRGLLWSSIAPIVAGGVLWYLAERNWSDAADKKKAYNKLSAFDSEDTRKMVRDNHRLNDRGDMEFGIAAGLGGIGLGLLTAGFILAF